MAIQFKEEPYSAEEKKEKKKETSARRARQKVMPKDVAVETTESPAKAILIPFLFAAVLVVVLFIAIRSGIEAKDVKQPVVVTAKAINKNTHITSKNIDKYFEIKKIDEEYVTKTSYTSFDKIPKDFYVTDKLTKGQLVYKDDIAKDVPPLNKYTTAASETTFSVENVADSLAGRTRAGDIVNMYAFDQNSESYVLVATQVYVVKAFTSDGIEITPEYEESAESTPMATMFTVLVMPEEEQAINAAIATHDIQFYQADTPAIKTLTAGTRSDEQNKTTVIENADAAGTEDTENADTTTAEDAPENDNAEDTEEGQAD